MRRYCRIRLFLLAGLLALVIPTSTARAVSISLVPDGSTTIEIGETVNVDVFMVLDAADQVAGIDAATMQLEGGSGFVDVVASSSGSVFPIANVNVFQPLDVIAFSQFGIIVRSPKALLGSLIITGRAQGSYDLVGRRIGGFPQFSAPGDWTNRYDFASNEALAITVVCSTGACPVGSPSGNMIRRNEPIARNGTTNQGPRQIESMTPEPMNASLDSLVIPYCC